MRRSAVIAGLISSVLVSLACSSGENRAQIESPTTTTSPSTTSSSSATTAPSTTLPPTSPRPEWLGRRALPIRSDGLGAIQPTPPPLVDRRFATIDTLPPPASDTFEVSVTLPSAAVVERSTWTDACPVTLDDLRYVTLPFWGFDGRVHTGELLVDDDAVDTVARGFETLFARQFPIEEMRIVRADELDLAPTGDGNNTTAFVCRPVVGSTTWSQHAHGRAVDINPFHNPYARGDVVIPELASAYLARPDLPGVLTEADVAAFVDDGWGWGGRWNSSKDWMHLSANGR